MASVAYAITNAASGQIGKPVFFRVYDRISKTNPLALMSKLFILTNCMAISLMGSNY